MEQVMKSNKDFVKEYFSDKGKFKTLGDIIKEDPSIESIAIKISEEIVKMMTLLVENGTKPSEYHISSTFDFIIGCVLAYNTFINNTLVNISKAGTYIRYGAMDLIRIANKPDEKHDIAVIIRDIIDRKTEEDTIKPADEAEVEKIINDTEEIINDLEEEITEKDSDSREKSSEENPFYESSDGDDSEEKYDDDEDDILNE